jgi:NTP pyrophosphatase (non-canonical NTP hydrolase)
MSNKATRALKRLSVRGQVRVLQEEVQELRDVLEESRRLNERLSDVLDVVTELLVPAVDRNEERLAESLKRI